MMILTGSLLWLPFFFVVSPALLAADRGAAWMLDVARGTLSAVQSTLAAAEEVPGCWFSLEF